MPNMNIPPEVPVTDRVGSKHGDIADRARDAKETVSDMATAASSKVEEGRATTAKGLDTAASAIHQRADELPGGPRVTEFAHSAADRLSTTAEYMRTHDTRRMMADVETVVKNNPGPALMIAAAFGFLLGRALSRD